MMQSALVIRFVWGRKGCNIPFWIQLHSDMPRLLWMLHNYFSHCIFSCGQPLGPWCNTAIWRSTCNKMQDNCHSNAIWERNCTSQARSLHAHGELGMWLNHLDLHHGEFHDLKQPHHNMPAFHFLWCLVFGSTWWRDAPMQALEDRFQMVTVQRDLETGPLKRKAGAQELNALACHINVDHLVLFGVSTWTYSWVALPWHLVADPCCLGHLLPLMAGLWLP